MIPPYFINERTLGRCEEEGERGEGEAEGEKRGWGEVVAMRVRNESKSYVGGHKLGREKSCLIKAKIALETYVVTGKKKVWGKYLFPLEVTLSFV